VGATRGESPAVGLRPAAHVAWREIGGEVFVIDLRAQQIFGLNESGGAVWRALEAGEEPGDGAVDFCRRLAELGLVEGEASAAAGNPDRGADGWVPPQVAWQEPLRSFGFSCAFQPGQSKECTSVPYE
jgi:hypothetical protein